jgi:drug/metabolite transporter (DMT)-like permease
MLRDGVSSWVVADLLALVAACLFALAATLQQKGALGMGDVSLGKPSSFVRLAKQTWWLFGTLALLAGYVFQAVALDRGKLAVIQPLLVTTIVFALPLGYLLTQQHVNREQVVAAGLVVLGLGFFIVVGKAASGNDNAPSWEWAVVIVVLGVASALLVVFGGRGSLARKAAAFGACAGLLTGSRPRSGSRPPTFSTPMVSAGCSRTGSSGRSPPQASSPSSCSRSRSRRAGWRRPSP